ncbi:hypothetical protein ScPMuIL_006027 [Solemya velum]
MKCVIPGVNIKVFGRAIHSLSKIGEEIYFEPQEDGLSLKTVNSSRSAYSCFLFAPSFFQDYDDGSGQIDSQDGEDNGLRCKITVKSCLTVFRSMSTIEKTVERCKITLNMDDSRLVFMLYCKHGIVKTHNLAFIECETLQAVFSKDLTPNVLTAPARLLCDVVMNFQTNQEEVSLILSPEKVSFKNYIEDEPDPNKVMHTELCLQPEEFDNCQVGVDTEVTFCLKELRAILAFAEVVGLPVSLHFETAGRPIVLSISSDASFEANFVLATLADAQTQTSGSQHPRSQLPSSSRYDMASATEISGPTTTQEEEDMLDDDMDDEMLGHDETMPSYTPSLQLDDLTATAPIRKPAPSRNRQGSPQPSTSRLSEQTERQTPTIPHRTTGGEQFASPVIPNQNTNTKPMRIDVSLLEEDDDDEEEEEAVPGTPPSKKFRSMFFGSQASTCTQLSQSVAPVLACDTDDED